MNKLNEFTLVSRTEFRQNLAYWLKRVKSLGPIYITVHGKVIARLEPVENRGKINGK